MPPNLSSRLLNLYHELKRRRVIRVATLYVVVFWPIIQIADILSPALDLPPQAMRWLLTTFVAGLPVVLVVAWVFDLNRSGVVRSADDTPAAEASAASRPLIGRNVERWIIMLLLLVIAVLFVVQRTQVGEPPAPRTGGPGTVQSIAVLPFATLSDNPADQFFSDGLTEELLNVLSRLQSLRVIARTTVFAYKGVNKNIQEIGQELKVGTILEGSVRRNDVDDTIRVTAQLIDVATGSHLWSRSFDRRFRDVFRIQDEIASAVVAELEVTLLAHERDRMTTRPSANPEALVAYSMGQSELAKRTRQSMHAAVPLFQRAIELDPGYVDAYAGLAIAYSLLDAYGVASGSDELAKAQEAATAAIAIDPTAAEAWAAQGLVHLQRAQKDAAREAMQKAIELNPSHAMAHMWLGSLQADPERKREYHARAFELDPKSPVAGYNLAQGLLDAGRQDEAMEVFNRIVGADPYFPGAYELIGKINEFRGRLDTALRHYRQSYELEPAGHVAHRLATLYVDLGEFDEADRWLRAAAGDRPSEEELMDLKWLEVTLLVARGQRTEADRLMRSMLETDGAGRDAHLNAAVAAYYLGDFPAVVNAYERAGGTPEVPHEPSEFPTNLDAELAAAYAYDRLGNDARAQRVLDALETLLDREINSRPRVAPDLWFTKARAAAVRGNHDVALVHLQRAVDEGWRQHWRPPAEPALAELRDMDNYQSMMAGLAARMDLMRENLAFDAPYSRSG